MRNEKAKKEASEMVLEELKKGVVPWRRTWLCNQSNKGIAAKSPYKGQNAAVTELARQLRGYSSRIWLTFAKFKELQKANPAARMKKGSKAVSIVLWREANDLDEDGNPILGSDGKPRTHWISLTWSVFNADCFENIVIEEPDAADVPYEELLDVQEKEAFLLSGYADRPSIVHDDPQSPYYDHIGDTIHIGRMCTFEDGHAYLSTLAHELAHSTEPRLGRVRTKDGYDMKSPEYGFGELVAELTACIVCSKLGILRDTLENSASYIKGWSKSISENPSWFWDAFGFAEKSADLILGGETTAQAV